MSNVIQDLERAQLRNVPRFKAGDTVRVHFQVIEGQRRRVQVFEGIVLKRQGAGVRETFTVRKQSFGVGVERTFPLHSPKIEKIEVMAIGDVNRAKLYYLRGRVGKKARIRERRYGTGSQLPQTVETTQPEPEAEAEAAEPEDARRPRGRGGAAEAEAWSRGRGGTRPVAERRPSRAEPEAEAAEAVAEPEADEADEPEAAAEPETAEEPEAAPAE